MAKKNRSLSERLQVAKIENEVDRQRGLEVLKRVYEHEKGWISDLDAFLPAKDVSTEHVSWFLAELDGRPVGVTRVMYRLPLELYEQYQMQLTDPGLDVQAFVREHRIAEVGRFAVLPELRRNIIVAAALMRAAATETVNRGFTHLITDVFESDPNSPMKFHQRILGFRTVATHTVGELNHLGRRITMLLDIKDSIRRLRVRNSWIYRFITEGWGEPLLQRLTA